MKKYFLFLLIVSVLVLGFANLAQACFIDVVVPAGDVTWTAGSNNNAVSWQKDCAGPFWDNAANYSLSLIPDVPGALPTISGVVDSYLSGHINIPTGAPSGKYRVSVTASTVQGLSDGIVTVPAPISDKFTDNEQVITNNEANVYSKGIPDGPSFLGTQPSGASGTVIPGGPVWDSDRWTWQIDFLSGPDGWVYESKLDKAAPALPTLTVTPAPAAGGSVTKTPSADSYAPGTTIKLEATANSGYRFFSWSGGPTGTTNPINYTMPSGDVYARALFTPTGTTNPTFTLVDPTIWIVGSRQEVKWSSTNLPTDSSTGVRLRLEDSGITKKVWEPNEVGPNDGTFFIDSVPNFTGSNFELVANLYINGAITANSSRSGKFEITSGTTNPTITNLRTDKASYAGGETITINWDTNIANKNELILSRYRSDGTFIASAIPQNLLSHTVTVGSTFAEGASYYYILSNSAGAASDQSAPFAIVSGGGTVCNNNGVCDAGETPTNCSADCTTTGNPFGWQDPPGGTPPENCNLPENANIIGCNPPINVSSFGQWKKGFLAVNDFLTPKFKFIPQTGTANGYVLTSDDEGNASWQVPTGGMGPGLSGLDCAGANQKLLWNGSTFSCGADLTGGTGPVDNNIWQSRVSGTCPAGSSIREIARNGAVTCEPDDVGTTDSGGGDITGVFGNNGLLSIDNFNTGGAKGEVTVGLNTASITDCIDSGTTYKKIVWDNTNKKLVCGTDQSGTTSGDNLGDHTMTKNLKTAGNYISRDGTNTGILVNANNIVGLTAGLTTPALTFTDSTKGTNKVLISSDVAGNATWGLVNTVNIADGAVTTAKINAGIDGRVLTSWGSPSAVEWRAPVSPAQGLTRKFYVLNTIGSKDLGAHDACSLAGVSIAGGGACAVNVGANSWTFPSSNSTENPTWYLKSAGSLWNEATYGGCVAMCLDFW